MPIRAVVYVSEACKKIASPTAESRVLLDVLVEDAKRFNRSAGVTGVLMFDGERFLQYMEGPMDGLSVAYSRVLGASSHHGLVELQQGRVGQRRLPYWPMRWLSLEPHDLRQLALSDWTRFNQRGDAQALNGTAMDRLIQLVEPHTRVA